MTSETIGQTGHVESGSPVNTFRFAILELPHSRRPRVSQVCGACTSDGRVLPLVKPGAVWYSLESQTSQVREGAHMDRESLKWLLIGLGGAAMTFLLMAGAGLYFYSLADRFIYEGPTQSGMEKRAEAEAEYFEKLEEYGLQDRYTIVTSEGEWRELLYEQGDFEAVDDYLEKLFNSDDEQESSFEYSSLCNGLGSFPYGSDPDRMRAVLDRWLEARPHSHCARVVLGRFLVNYAWAWRGGGYADTVSDESRAKFRSLLKEARTVLEEARLNRPHDAEPSNILLSVALGLGLPRETMESYYADAVEAAPHHYGARSAKLEFIFPKWYGSWEEADAFLQECRDDAKQHPNLRILQYYGYREMSRARSGYEDILKDSNNQQEITSIYEDSLKKWPDSLSTLCNYAFALYNFQEYEKSIAVFEQIGDRFHTSSAWSSVIAYNRARAGAYAAYSSEMENVDVRESYMDRAVELAPYDGYPFFKRGRFYAQAGRMEEAEADALAAIGIDKNYLKAHELLAYVYAQQRRFSDIVAICDTMLAEDINDETRKLMNFQKKRAEGYPQSAGNVSTN